MDEILEKEKGLTTGEVGERIREHGLNELPSQKKRNIFTIFLNVLKEPMLLLLVAAGSLYFILGETKDALMLMTFVFVVIGITFYQERKTERALEALKNLSSPRALVIRNGIQERIAGREVVIDDLIILREGDRVPADGIVITQRNLTVDESLLTGESLAVGKSDWNKKEDFNNIRPGGDNLSYVYSGTLVTQGRGIIKVSAIGLKTEMGKIGKSLQTIKEEDTLLKKETSRIVRDFGFVGIILCIIVVIFYTLTRGEIAAGFLAGLTLGMAMLPQEFPVVLIIFLSLGAWRISKRQVLTRNTAAIETLGAAKVLCVDKTGTLTLNRMRLELLSAQDKDLDLKNNFGKDLADSFHNLLEYAILASQKDPFDPLEKEIKQKGEELLIGTEHLHKSWSLIQEYPLSKELLALSHIWESPDRSEFIIATKGAPEAIADLCHFTEKEKEKLLEKIKALSAKGYRLIGVANSSFKKSSLPHNQHDFKFEFVGLLGFTDPVRADVPASVKKAYTAGIRIIMITGDYPGTAQFIAKEIGLENPDQYVTGEELEKMSESELREKIKTVNIFARVVPEQKLAIINALKQNREIVAMTGDGVNDAPALKSSNIGISMGERGTDVAREASDLVLLNDDFASIVEAVSMGRRIFDNLKKAISYIFSAHVPIAGMSVIPILFNLPIVLFPAHIAFLELIIDPACSMVFESEKEEADVMQRPPRNLKNPLFNKKSMLISITQGLSVLVIVFLVFLLSLKMGKAEADSRTLSFVVIVIANLMLILTNLSWTKNVFQILRGANKTLFWILVGTLFFLSLILYTPVLRDLFHFSVLHLDDLVITFSAGIISVIWFEGLKIMQKLKTKAL